MARKKVYGHSVPRVNGPPPIFGKRHFKRLSACLKAMPQAERIRFGVFMTAVFMDDNPQFDKDIFLKESGVLE
jgi:hypothetical protein